MKEGIQLDQMGLFIAINKEITRQFPKTAVIPRQVNAVIAAANAIVAEFANGEILTTPGMGLTAWLASDDWGVSSKFMAGVLSGKFVAEKGYPRDPDDFGRCRRLILAVPELAGKIDLMRDYGKKWITIADNWNDWVAMYDAGDDSLYAAMKMAYGGDE